jgi:hypothetical protein
MQHAFHRKRKRTVAMSVANRQTETQPVMAKQLGQRAARIPQKDYDFYSFKESPNKSPSRPPLQNTPSLGSKSLEIAPRFLPFFSFQTVELCHGSRKALDSAVP